jgi:hypothetical protein
LTVKGGTIVLSELNKDIELPINNKNKLCIQDESTTNKIRLG